MFRRFGVIDKDGNKIEVTLNLKYIASIELRDGETRIYMARGTYWQSAIEYEHLSSALDGYRF